MINRPFLNLLLDSDSVSGNEQHTCDLVKNTLYEVASFHTDSIGNLYATVNETGDYKILLEAHIDEVGFQVNYIDKEGYIYLRACGGIDLTTAIGQMVCISNRKGEKVYGVIGKKPVHLLKGEEKNRTPEIESIWVDTGLSYEVLLDSIFVGDYVSVCSNHRYLSDNKLAGKGLDNKLGVYVVSEVIRRITSENVSDISVTALFSTQEELGCKGASVAALGNDYDEIISVDVTFSSDVPDVSPKIIGDIKLGNGPVLFLHSDVSRIMVDEIVAKAQDIDIQMSANYVASGGTDIRPLQLSTKRAKTALVGLPLRYMHTPVEMCDLRDVDNTVNLIVNYLKSKRK